MYKAQTTHIFGEESEWGVRLVVLSIINPCISLRDPHQSSKLKKASLLANLMRTKTRMMPVPKKQKHCKCT